MSFYNSLFGMNEETPVLLGMIGVNREYFRRFRDVDLIKGGTIIRVFARLGGENREDFQETWDKIRTHKRYLKDYDDEFDETYAYIEYEVPDKFKETSKKMFKCEPVPFEERFRKTLDEMNKPGTKAYETAEIIAKRIVNTIENNEGGIQVIEI